MHRKSMAVLWLCLFGLIAAGKPAFAQAPVPVRDTLKIGIKQAEEQFLKNNLDLLVQHYNIESTRAQVITARLFDNPSFGFSNILYNPESKKIFDVSRNGGQYSASISQLFLTAGKRNKNVRLANINVQQAEFQFYNLLRTLRYTLRSDFYKIYFQEQTAQVYQDQINSLAKTFQVFQLQYGKGNIAQKEVLRIQSQLYSLQTEYGVLQDSIDNVQTEFKMLTRVAPKTYVVPTLDYNLDGKDLLAKVPYQQLLDSAYNNRPDLKITRSALEYNDINLKLQKAMAVPDLTLGLSYDKQGSFVRDFNSVDISFPIPFFNRNQGGIKQAKIAIEEGKTQLQAQQQVVDNELDNSYQSAFRLEKLYNSFDPKFKADFTHLIGEVFINYQKKNISLLEFLDFYDSYKTNTIQLNNLQLNRISSLEQLNYVTGTAFFNR